VAEQLGRNGDFVVTMDPLVTLDGSAALPASEESTAGRIVAAGGAARASAVSVTDRDGVRALFADLVAEKGRLDAVVNVAGITRPTSFAAGTDDDWRRVLEVHLDGYLNVLAAALPIMAAAGHGRILGVTSGSGWRPADTGAYGCAKRAVAALTWQLGRRPPPGVVVNAMSPIAVTRMVTAALERAQRAPGATGSTTGGLSLGSMPEPDEIGPFGAHLVGDDLSWCSGRVLFAGGPEVALVDEPRLLEVVQTDDVAVLEHLLARVTASALVAAEAKQASGGGSNPRFATAFDESAATTVAAADVRTCAVVADRPEIAAAITAALEARSVTCAAALAASVRPGFSGAAEGLASAIDRVGPLDAIVVALGGVPPSDGGAGDWEQVLAEHAGIVDRIHTDAAWSRAASDHAAAADRPLRLVTLTDATTAGGRSRAQASAQLARSGRGATGDRVSAFAVSVESAAGGDQRAIGEVAAHLVGSAEATGLSGAELVLGRGWFGLRSHPRPTGSVVLGSPGAPDWLDTPLREIVGASR
jgi:NAD(P)-dependent dehydrogenase (short-subunit alcohol dehydrogenase family)